MKTKPIRNCKNKNFKILYIITIQLGAVAYSQKSQLLGKIT
jgi:hypothetical protein